jgi:hypothetical protein
MVSQSRITVLGAGVMVALLTGTGCKLGPSAEMQNKVDQLTKVSTERDRLLGEMAENARMMSQISADLARVRVPAGAYKVKSESPQSAARDSVVMRIRYITNRVNETERKLGQSEQRVRELTTVSDSLRQTLQATIDNYKSVVEEQKATIVALTDQINQLTDTVNLLKEKNNTVYYIIGTKDELIQKGVVVQQGGSRFPLLFAKVGQTIVPSRNLNPAAFTRINMREVTEIPLPGSDGYRVASRQDLDGLVAPPADGRHISGTLKIANPDKFWSGSRFLILIQG